MVGDEPALYSTKTLKISPLSRKLEVYSWSVKRALTVPPGKANPARRALDGFPLSMFCQVASRDMPTESPKRFEGTRYGLSLL